MGTVCQMRFELVRLRAVCFTIIFSWITSTLFCQQFSSGLLPVVPDLLSSSTVRCIYKDSKGYMWFGTANGLIRFDGVNAYRYMHNPGDRSSITHNTINVILENRDQDLLIGTAQGLCIYNKVLDNFVNLDSIEGNRNYLTNRYITSVAVDDYGNYWVGTHEGGINVYDPVKKEFSYIIEPAHKGIMPSTNFINVLYNHEGVIWCGSKGGLLLYNSATKRRIPLNSLNYFSDKQVTDIVLDKRRKLMLATLTGEIAQIVSQSGQFKFRKILSGEEFAGSSNRVLALDFDLHGNMLVGGEEAGFNYVDTKTWKVTRWVDDEATSNRLPINSVQSIYVDNEGIIWIGTLNNGVFRFDNRKKKFEASTEEREKSIFSNREARSFVEDEYGNIWIAYYGVGIGKIDTKTNTWQNLTDINQKITNKNLSSIIYDRYGEIWVGTLGKGVYRINLKNRSVINYSIKSDGFGNDQVFCLYESGNGTIWAGTWGSGLFYFDTKNQKFVNSTEYSKSNHIPNTAYVTTMMEGSDGKFWVGTLYGLYELDETQDFSFTYKLHVPDSTAGSISGALIQALCEDKEKNLWIATEDNGLNLKERGSTTFKFYQTENGLRSNTIRSLLVDEQGNVWMGSNRGLSKLIVSTNTIINYGIEDGLKTNNFYTNASLISSEGKFFFGNNYGFTSFFPDSIRVNPIRPTLYLSDLKINNQSVRPGAPDSPLSKHISLASEIELLYDQRSFAIDFVALDYNHSSDYTYCYKLQNFDEEWNCIGSNHTASYTNIDPGHYVFMVKAANQDGVWTETPIQLKINIQQVFWKTWWAFAIYFSIVFIIIYAGVKFRIERLKIKNQLLLERLAREQEHELSESKTQFFTNISHEFRTPLSLVMMPLESLITTENLPAQFSERIATAYKNAGRMMRLVNELMDFAKLENGNLQLKVVHGELVSFIIETCAAFNEVAKKRKITFTVSSSIESLTGWFDRDKLERIIFNVLSNAFKFTAAGGTVNLQINIRYTTVAKVNQCRCLELVIVDNGMGISADEIPHIFEKFYQAKSATKVSSPGAGIGLSLTKALVELHQGKISVESVPDRETVFNILLPIDAAAFQIDNVPQDLIGEASDIHINKYPLQQKFNIDADDSSAKPEILVAEDNDELREYLVAELKKEFLVLEVKDGHEGLLLARQKNPSVIISDVMMPNMDGIEFCKAIKNDLETCHIPFILLTAKSTIQDQILGIGTGADVYITKPFNVQYLMTHVFQVIESRQKLYSRFSQEVYLMPAMVTSNALDEAFLQKAIDFITDNLQDTQLGVDTIASFFNLSRMQIYRKIKGLTGKSVVEFIRTVRMKQAIKLMDTQKYTLSEIAFEVGFSSSSYFTKCFKDEYGKTPSDFLQQQR